MNEAFGYNERLFTGKGLRSFIHLARFEWARRVTASLGLSSIKLIEIGCFDGRLLDYMPGSIERYVGLDAGWEGGLELARKRFQGQDKIALLLARDPSPIGQFDSGSFNLAAALETLEHVPPDLVDDYLAALARVVNGYFLVSVPNERGAVFLAKFLAKKLVLGGSQDYRVSEVFAATMGWMSHIKRSEHKGFDYNALIAQIGRHFDVIRVDSLPLAVLPTGLSITIGIVARSWRRDSRGG